MPMVERIIGHQLPAMLIGGGLNGGQVLGGTNDSLMTRGINLTTGQADDSQSPLSYDHLLQVYFMQQV